MESDNLNDIRRTMAKLAERLARVEARLGLGGETSHTASPSPASQSAHDVVSSPPTIPTPPLTPRDPSTSTLETLREQQRARAAVPPASVSESVSQTPPPFAPTNVRPTVAPPVIPLERSVEQAIAALRSPPVADAIKSQPVAPPTAVPSSPKRSVELAIGRSWLAWIGAIVILIAGALFITTAYREGWIGAISPTMRCLAVAGFGVLLLGAGEWAYRKIARMAAVGFYSAGLGTLYLDAYATSAWFNILPESAAFGLLACVALIGFALTLRARMLTIGVLSVVGGYLAPVLVGSAGANPAAPAVYLTLLLAIALALSAFAPRPMRALRYVTLGGHAVLSIVWLEAALPGMWLVAIVAMSIWWCMIVGESVFAALRRQSNVGNIFAVALATAFYTIIGCGILNQWPAVGPNWLGIFTFAIAAVSVAIALHFGPGIESLRARPITPIDKLAVALILQGAVLFTVAIALFFDDVAQGIAWLAVGLAAIEAGRRLPSRGMDIFGLITGALGVANVVLVESWTSSALRNVVVSLPNLELTGWGILATLTALAILIASKRLRAEVGSAWVGVKIALAAFAVVGWFFVSMTQGSGLVVTWLWLAAALALIVFERFGRREMFFEIGLVALGAVAARWLLADAVADRMNASWEATAALPVINWQMGLALAIGISAWLAVRIAQSRTLPVPQTQPATSSPGRSWAIALATLFGAAFLLIAMSFEVDRIVMRASVSAAGHQWSIDQVRQLLLTALWAMGTVCVQLFAYSLGKRGGPAGTAASVILRASWVVLILCTGKWMLIDTLAYALLKPADIRIGLLPVANVQFITAVAITLGTSLMLAMLRRRAMSPPQPSSEGATLREQALAQRSPFDRTIALFVPTMIAVLVLWALSFEVERWIGRLEVAGIDLQWPAAQSRALAITALWASGSIVMAFIGKRREGTQLVTASLMLAVGSAIVWLTLDTLAYRFEARPLCTTLFINLQFMTGALVIAALVLTQRFLRSDSFVQPTLRAVRGVAWGLVAAIVLWLGSFEIDRAFAAGTVAMSENAVTARQMCWSVYWGLFAFSLIAVGFRIPSPWARYAGMAMFGLTLLKVLALDMHQVDTIYRVASVATVGIMLVITSMAYAKLAPKLLASNDVHSPPDELP